VAIAKARRAEQLCYAGPVKHRFDYSDFFRTRELRRLARASQVQGKVGNGDAKL
jgi:hypothetical protein